MLGCVPFCVTTFAFHALFNFSIDTNVGFSLWDTEISVFSDCLPIGRVSFSFVFGPVIASSSLQHTCWSYVLNSHSIERMQFYAGSYKYVHVVMANRLYAPPKRNYNLEYLEVFCWNTMANRDKNIEKIKF